MILVAVVLAGALGAGARFVVDHAVSHASERMLPVGTLVVNVSGSTAAGVLAGVAARHGLDDTVQSVAGTGFLGAFTTFSTFAVQAVHLAEAGVGRIAALHVAAHLVLATGAAAVGYALALT